MAPRLTFTWFCPNRHSGPVRKRSELETRIIETGTGKVTFAPSHCPMCVRQRILLLTPHARPCIEGRCARTHQFMEACKARHVIERLKRQVSQNFPDWKSHAA